MTATIVNPARAGMIPRRWGQTAFNLRKPRASGDDPGPYRRGLTAVQ